MISRLPASGVENAHLTAVHPPGLSGGAQRPLRSSRLDLQSLFGSSTWRSLGLILSMSSSLIFARGSWLLVSRFSSGPEECLELTFTLYPASNRLHSCPWSIIWISFSGPSNCSGKEQCLIITSNWSWESRATWVCRHFSRFLLFPQIYPMCA